MISPFAHMENQKTGTGWVAARLTPEDAQTPGHAPGN
jgi:hypothetical protein